jgi:hypothetical protein
MKNKSLKIQKKAERTKEKQILFKFLKRTKSGEYASVEKSAAPYSRIDEQTEVVDQVYYYGLN